ncbi:MAG: DUF2294 family protein [Solirubrobacteraceae bacterium]|nr:DUF2294 family protein [Solirubrobacteraceae bacterium]
MTATEPDYREAIREIVHCIVTLEKEHYGKGPERTVVRVLPGMVVALLHEPYTPGEVTLIEAGRHEAVFAHRRELNAIMDPGCADVVSKELGLPVFATMSSCHVAPNLGVKVFITDDSLSAQ